MYQIDCQKINSYGDFIEEFNKNMIRSVGGEWNGNLDAFNDYLSWPEPNPYKLVIKGTDRCKEILNYKANEKHEKNLWPLLEEIFLDNKEFVDVEFK